MWKKLLLAVGLVVVHFFYTKNEIKEAKDVATAPADKPAPAEQPKAQPKDNVTPLTTPPSSA